VFALTNTSANAAPEIHEAGRAIYNFRCYFCHGYSGDARTLAARYLIPPPRDFTAAAADVLERDSMLRTVSEGRPGTAMMSFSATLGETEIAAVVDFIRLEFISQGRSNSRYHTKANGWPDHDRYRTATAFPYATGDFSLDSPWQDLSPSEQSGKRLFLRACISCHDTASSQTQSTAWEREAVSYPRFGFQPGDSSKPPDAWSGASPFAAHDVPPVVEGLGPVERQGERLFQDNCAFCHAADGTGKNWIGRFMEPHPRDLTDRRFMLGMTRSRLVAVIQDGLLETSMPAWGNVLSEQQIGAIAGYIDVAFHPLTAESGD